MIFIVKKDTETNKKILESMKSSDFDFSFFRIVNTKPSSTSDAGEKYDVYIDDDYIYFCLSTNYWKRINLQRF